MGRTGISAASDPLARLPIDIASRHQSTGTRRRSVSPAPIEISDVVSSRPTLEISSVKATFRHHVRLACIFSFRQTIDMVEQHFGIAWQ